MTVNILFFTRQSNNKNESGKFVDEITVDLPVQIQTNSNFVEIQPEVLRSMGVKLPKDLHYLVEVM